MEHLGLAISLCFASLLVCNISSRAKIIPRTRRGSLIQPTLSQRQQDETGARSWASLSIEAEALPLQERLLRAKAQAGSSPPHGEKPREGLRLWDRGMLRASLQGKRVSFAANKVRALFQHSETYILLCICHMALLYSSTCVVAVQCWGKRAPKLRGVAAGEVALAGTRWMVVPKVGGDN